MAAETASIVDSGVYNNYKNNDIAQFYFKLNITMLFNYGYGQQLLSDNKKCRRIAGDFDCHTVVAVRCRAHRLIEHVQGFTRSHWMPPSEKCLRRIALAAVKVDEFVETTLNTNKTQLLPTINSGA